MDSAALFGRFRKSWSEINAAYEAYARGLGISYTLLQVLCELYTADGTVTQRTICESCHLPKTTVNAIISGLVRQSYAELEELPADRRQKAVRLTEAGLGYVTPIMEHMSGSELAAFATLNEETAKIMLQGIEAYQRNFNERLNHQEGETCDGKL